MIKRRKNVRITEKSISRFRDKHICARCNTPFDTDELLQSHRQYQHGEYRENDELRETPRKSDYVCKTEQRIPKRKDWSKQVGDNTYLYDPWFKVYRVYKLGEGLLDDLDRVLANEESKYFQTLRTLIDNPRMKIPSRPTPLPKITRRQKYYDARAGKPITLIDESLLPRDCYQCLNCGEIVRITISGQERCPDCNKWVNVNGGSQVIISDKVKTYDLGNGNKSTIHKCKIVNHDTLGHRKPVLPRVDTETALTLCPCCEYNIFRLNPLIAKARKDYEFRCNGVVNVVVHKGRI